MSRAEDDEIERIMSARSAPANIALTAPKLAATRVVDGDTRATIRAALQDALRTLASVGAMTTCPPRLRADIAAWTMAQRAALSILDAAPSAITDASIASLRSAIRGGAARCEDVPFSVPKILPAQRAGLLAAAGSLYSAIDLLAVNNGKRRPPPSLAACTP